MLDDFSYLLSVLFFVVTLILATYVFFRLSFRVDKAALVISVAYLTSMFFRLPFF